MGYKSYSVGKNSWVRILLCGEEFLGTKTTLWGRILGFKSYFVGKNSWVKFLLCGEEFFGTIPTLWGRIFGQKSNFVGKNSWVQILLCGEEFFATNLALWGRILWYNSFSKILGPFISKARKFVKNAFMTAPPLIANIAQNGHRNLQFTPNESSE